MVYWQGRSAWDSSQGWQKGNKVMWAPLLQVIEELHWQLEDLEDRSLRLSEVAAEVEETRRYLDKAEELDKAGEAEKAMYAFFYAAVCYGVALSELVEAEKLKRKVNETLT